MGLLKNTVSNFYPDNTVITFTHYSLLQNHYKQPPKVEYWVANITTSRPFI